MTSTRAEQGPPDPVFLATAVEIVLQAGRASGFHVDKKGTIDLVTEVDIECERMCRAILAERFPDHDILAEGLATATSPGRLQILGTEPTVIIDAAHNPHGAKALALAIPAYFNFKELVLVVGILADKDAHGIVDALAPLAARIHVTQSKSDRAIPAEELSDQVAQWTHDATRLEFGTLEGALSEAREWADAGPGRAVLVTGSITLIGEAIEIATEQGWKR